MKQIEAIILAGGLGTRLQSVVADRPKAMAEVCGKPFLEYILKYLEKQGIQRVILALGYKSEIITEWIKTFKTKISFSYSFEDEPLGTGGAIKQALNKINQNYALVLNGDTLFEVDLNKMLDLHLKNNAPMTLALKSMTEFDRYGTVEMKKNGVITKFNEKKYCNKGLINGGVYLITKDNHLMNGLNGKFSFENQVLEIQAPRMNLYGIVDDGYFIDIGIPEDFDKAQKDFICK